MFSATCADYLSVSHHMLTLFEGLLLCFVEMFYWGCLQNTQICNAAQMQRNADPWISHCTLALSVQRRVCVMGADSFWLFAQLNWKTTQREPVNTIFTLSSGCCKDNYLVISLQPRKALISATWSFQAPGLSGDTAQPWRSHRFGFVFFFPGPCSCPSSF